MGNSCGVQKKNQKNIANPIKLDKTDQKLTKLMKSSQQQGQIIESMEYEIGDYFLKNSYLNMNLSEQQKGKENEFYLQILSQHELKTRVFEDYFKTDLEQLLFQTQSTKTLRKKLLQNPQMKYRRILWKILLFDQNFYENNEFEKIERNHNAHFENIKKDLHRTFPNQKYFNQENNINSQTNTTIPNNKGQSSLMEVLQCISISFPLVGYCQGMNFVIALFLMIHDGNKNSSFYSFNYLAQKDNYMMSGFFEDGFPLLSLYQNLFWEVFLKKNKKLGEHAQNWNLPEPAWITKWFLTLYIYSFPLDFVVRVIDYVIVHGLFFLIKVGVQFMLHYEQLFYTFDMTDFDAFLKNIKENGALLLFDKNQTFYLDIEVFLQKAQAINISNSLINQTASNLLKNNNEKSNFYLKYYSIYQQNTSTIGY